jgi:hypothetical protein
MYCVENYGTRTTALIKGELLSKILPNIAKNTLWRVFVFKQYYCNFVLN